MTDNMTETKIALTIADGVADSHTFHAPGAQMWPGVTFYLDCMDGIGLAFTEGPERERLMKLYQSSTVR